MRPSNRRFTTNRRLNIISGRFSIISRSSLAVGEPVTPLVPLNKAHELSDVLDASFKHVAVEAQALDHSSDDFLFEGIEVNSGFAFVLFGLGSFVFGDLEIFLGEINFRLISALKSKVQGLLSPFNVLLAGLDGVGSFFLGGFSFLLGLIVLSLGLLLFLLGSGGGGVSLHLGFVRGLELLDVSLSIFIDGVSGFVDGLLGFILEFLSLIKSNVGIVGVVVDFLDLVVSGLLLGNSIFDVKSLLTFLGFLQSFLDFSLVNWLVFDGREVNLLLSGGVLDNGLGENV